MSYYDHIAKGYEALHREEQFGKLKLVLERMPYSKTDKLLDVGCGTGLGSALFGCEKFGVDSSIELLKQARQRMPVVRGLAESLPFADKCFDKLVCLTALHNFGNPEQALKEMKRVCKGRMVVSVLKRAKRFDELLELINKTFKVKEMLEEWQDVIVFCEQS